MSFQSRWSDYCVLDSQERVSSRDEEETVILEDRSERMEEEPSVSGIEERMKEESFGSDVVERTEEESFCE